MEYWFHYCTSGIIWLLLTYFGCFYILKRFDYFKHCLAVEKLKVGRRRRRTRNGEGDVSCEKWDARCHQTSYFPSGPASSLIVMAILFVIIIFVRYSITKVEREIFNPCNSSKGNMVFWTCLNLCVVLCRFENLNKQSFLH